jgi:hypothetical protein
VTEIRGDRIRVVHPLFHSGGGGSTPTSPLQLHVEPIPFTYARELNGLWHSRLPTIGTGFVDNQPFICFAAIFGGLAYAAAIWSNPVARNLPQDTCLELRRYAIAPDAPPNTASRMLSVMVRLVRRERPWLTLLISYQDEETHAGTIYKASGWEPASRHAGGSWNRPNSRNASGTRRTRPDANRATGPKTRWQLKLAA